MKLTSLVICLQICLISISQNWQTKSNLPALGRDDGVAFSIFGRGYCVTGKTNSNFDESNQLFMYNKAFDSWEEKATFPGLERQYASIFVINNIAYLIGGYSINGNALKDVWAYNPISDKWSQKADFPMTARWSAVSFSNQNKGYLCCGISTSSLHKDFWQYSPDDDTWNQLTDFPGEARRDAIGEASYNSAIVGLGLKSYDIPGHFSDLYQYNFSTNSWIQLADFPGGKRSYAFCDIIASRIFVGGGMNGNLEFQNDVWAYNLLKENWKFIDTVNIQKFRGASSFVIEEALFLCTGLFQNGRSNFLRSRQFKEEMFEVFPNPSSGMFYLKLNPSQYPVKISVHGLDGKSILQMTSYTNFIDLNHAEDGIYVLQLDYSNGSYTQRKIILER